MKRYITTIALVTGIFAQLILAGPTSTNPEYSEGVIENEILLSDNEMVPGLEDWMIANIDATTEQVSLELDYRLEDWMLETDKSNTIIVEDELELEPWMESSSAVLEDVTIEIENWMFISHR